MTQAVEQMFPDRSLPEEPPRHEEEKWHVNPINQAAKQIAWNVDVALNYKQYADAFQ